MENCRFLIIMDNIQSSVIFIIIGTLLQTIYTKDEVNQQGEFSAGIVLFNNPKLLRELEKSLEESTLFDQSENAVDPNKIGGVFLKNEAGSLGYMFRMLTIDEMGVTHMQVSKCMLVIHWW